MKLFEEYPHLENSAVILRKMTRDDIPSFAALTEDEEVKKTLPTFLYEQKYADKGEMLERMDEECFNSRESLFLGIYLTDDPDRLVGIAEVYNYEENKSKASVGCRLARRAWGQGIAPQVLELMKRYLLEDIGLETLTAHILRENTSSARVAGKCGFVCKYPGLWEDWGRADLQLTDKYVFKREWLEDSGQAGESMADSAAARMPAVFVEQFVMAYRIEQDRIRAMLPEGFTSLRPVLRINAEIRTQAEEPSEVIYLEFNTPVEATGRRGWLNIANWKSTRDPLICKREGKSVTMKDSLADWSAGCGCRLGGT